jgi:hypothetical protein
MNALPFERGTYTCGSCEVGAEFYDPKNKQTVQIVKNTDAAAVAPKRVVRWETPAVYEVDYASTAAHGLIVAGVSDPLLAAAGAPVNSFFFIVVEGVVTIAVGSGATATVAGKPVKVDDDTAKGRIGGVADIATGSLAAVHNDNRYAFAIAHAAGTGTVTPFVQCRLALRR